MLARLLVKKQVENNTKLQKKLQKYQLCKIRIEKWLFVYFIFQKISRLTSWHLEIPKREEIEKFNELAIYQALLSYHQIIHR